MRVKRDVNLLISHDQVGLGELAKP